MRKITVTRGSILRVIKSGTARAIFEGVLGPSTYIDKDKTFSVSSFNLYAQGVTVVDEDSKDSYNFDYDFVLNNCELISKPNTLGNLIITSMAFVSFDEEPEETHSILDFLVVYILILQIVSVVKLFMLFAA